MLRPVGRALADHAWKIITEAITFDAELQAETLLKAGDVDAATWMQDGGTADANEITYRVDTGQFSATSRLVA